MLCQGFVEKESAAFRAPLTRFAEPPGISERPIWKHQHPSGTTGRSELNKLERIADTKWTIKWRIAYMARYNGPKARINRRLGMMVYESAGAIRAFERRDSPPGMRTRIRRPSNYGQALMEKQKIKHHYGLGERQLRRLRPSNTGVCGRARRSMARVRQAVGAGERLLQLHERVET